MKYSLPNDLDKTRIPSHIGIIMDGNGRWAQNRKMPRLYGHGMGYRAIKPITEASLDFGVKTLSLYAFSSENWSRPSREVSGIMNLLKVAIKQQASELVKMGVKFIVSGRIEGISEPYKSILEDITYLTKDCNKITMNLCFNYGGRNEIVDAIKSIAEKIKMGDLFVTDIDDKLISSFMYHPEIPDPELVIRTGGESRISNFLLWEVAYSELYITDIFWPDFTPDNLAEAIRYYQNKDRRFGGIGK